MIRDERAKERARRINSRIKAEPKVVQLKEKKLKIGSVVRLKGDIAPVRMTVNDLQADGFAECVWFYQGIMHAMSFHTEALTVLEE